MFIAFEGIDGAGKSTVSVMVKHALEKKGHNVFLTREPTDRIEWTDSLKKGRDAIAGLSLFFRFTEDRFRHQNEIREHLDAGEIVLCDRYIMSSLAYQGALIEGLFDSRQRTVEWMLQVSSIILQRPQLTFYIDLDPAISIKRLRSRSELTGFEEVKYLDLVREFYNYIELEGKIKINGSGTVEETYGTIMEEIEKRLKP